MNTKLDELFATLRGLISDQSRDLAMARSELRSVAAELDKALTERDASRAGYAAMNTRIYGPGGECHELDKARADIAEMDFALEMERINTSHARAERDTARQSLRAAEADVAETESANSDLRTVNARLVADLAAAMERLAHAESILMQ
jgi:chromosome segregation ATPase